MDSIPTSSLLCSLDVRPETLPVQYWSRLGRCQQAPWSGSHVICRLPHSTPTCPGMGGSSHHAGHQRRPGHHPQQSPHPPLPLGAQLLALRRPPGWCCWTMTWVNSATMTQPQTVTLANAGDPGMGQTGPHTTVGTHQGMLVGATTHLSSAATTGSSSRGTWDAGRGQEGSEEGLGEIRRMESWEG